MKDELRALIERALRWLRRIPRAYTIGPALFALAIGMLVASLTVEPGIVGGSFRAGEAPPGIAEFNVSFRATPVFQATLVVGDCGIGFHLLNDSAYQAYQTDGTLPTATLDCSRRDALVAGPVGHLVTDNMAAPSSMNSSFAISVAFLGTRAPFALLSIPAAGLALGVTIWVSMTIMARGTDRLLSQARQSYEKRWKK